MRAAWGEGMPAWLARRLHRSTVCRTTVCRYQAAARGQLRRQRKPHQHHGRQRQLASRWLSSSGGSHLARQAVQRGHDGQRQLPPLVRGAVDHLGVLQRLVLVEPLQAVQRGATSCLVSRHGRPMGSGQALLPSPGTAPSFCNHGRSVTLHPRAKAQLCRSAAPAAGQASSRRRAAAEVCTMRSAAVLALYTGASSSSSSSSSMASSGSTSWSTVSSMLAAG